MSATVEVPQSPSTRTRSDKPRLLQKLIAAQKAVETVPKDSRNEFHKYAYTSIEGLVKATRAELIQRDVIVIAGISHIEERERQTSQGTSVVSDVHVTMTVYDAETNESFEVPWVGRGDDPADKGLAKALTDARKTFTLHLLNIARGDDTEADATTDERTYGQTVNLIGEVQGSGLTNAQLNQILVGAGLPAQQKPFGFFGRVPEEHANAVRGGIVSMKGQAP